jgi:PAS domain S-box-containing protein
MFSLNNKKLHTTNGWFSGLLAFFLMLFIATVVIYKIELAHLEKKHSDATKIADENIHILNQNINQILSLGYPLAAMIEHGENLENFRAVSQKLVSSFPFLTEIALAPGGIITEVIPLEGNEKVIGLNLFETPEQKSEALLARQTGKMTLTGVTNLVQGGQGLIARLPIFAPDDKKFWGFIFLVIRFPDILDTISFNKMKDKGYTFSLSYLRVGTNNEQILKTGLQNAQLQNPIEKTITFPNATWILRIVPTQGWIDYSLLIIEVILGLFICILVGYITKQYTELNSYRYSLEEKVQEHTCEILKTKNQLRTLLNTIPDLIWLKDTNGVYLFCNPMFEKLFNATQEQIIGKTDYDFVDKELAIFFRENDTLAMQTNKTSINEEWLTFAKNSYHGLFETSKTPVYDDDNKLIGTLGISRDITQRYKDNESIEKLSQMMIAQSQYSAMGEMINMIADQWRQPLTTISVEVNNLIVNVKLNTITNDSILKYSQTVLSQIEQLSTTIDDFRKFLRPSKELEEVNTKEIIDEVHKIMNKSLEKANIKLTVEHNSKSIIKTHSRELLQIYLNLLNNAKETFIHENSTQREIKVSIDEDKSNLITTICHNGETLDEVLISKIFSPYFTHNSKNSTSNLGLYITKAIIQNNLHGTIQAKRQTDGTCFEIIIPKATV